MTTSPGLMRQEGIRGAKRRGKPWRTTIADPQAHRRPDLVERDFTAERPDASWVGDLTYRRTWGGRMYFAFLIDVFSRMIVGWQLASHMRTDLSSGANARNRSPINPSSITPPGSTHPDQTLQLV
ncbi:MAG: DDE-type integrase/transposase/recombinase [Solirubrobacteraceae bacterium]